MTDDLFWAIQKEKTRKHLLARYTSLASANHDFGVQHPNLKKEILNKSIQNKVELKKFINDMLDKKFKYAQLPKDSVVIKRFNRIA